MTQNRTGVWLLGACGSVATTVMAGGSAVARGLVPPTGLVTELSDFAPLELVGLGDLVFGGYEARPTRPIDTARTIAANGGSIPASLVESVAPDLDAAASRILPAPTLDRSEAIREWAGQDRLPPRRTAREAIARIASDLGAFARATSVQRTIVVNLTSAEAIRPEQETAAADLASLEALLDRVDTDGVSPGLLYAYAALTAGCPYVNFTTAAGTELPALAQLALERGLPHAGKDGKTGETLLKTTLAPMFLARHFRVLAWEGHNILGGGDGRVLASDENRSAKTRTKGRALEHFFGEGAVHSGVRIDYVPSLGEWKTAWDFIHFEGFLGVRMMLQLLWQGCDSALAAPLVLDLVRLADLAHRRGEVGAMEHTASFFKDPIGSDEHDFHRQFDRLRSYVRQGVGVA